MCDQRRIWVQATSNSIHRSQEHVVISDGLVPGTITTVGSLKQFQLIEKYFFCPTSVEYGFQATSNNIYRTQERVLISDGLVPGTITYY